MTIFPAGHVCLVGEPGAGRSDLIDGLIRVLSPEFTRSRLATELDFYKRDTGERAEVEVVLGALGENLEQTFLDHLEVWERETKELVDELAEPEHIDRDRYELVLRLCYRAAWNVEEDQADHWVDYPKNSDPDAGLVDRVGRAERQTLVFASMDWRARVLDLSTTGIFRKMVEALGLGDFQQAIKELEAKIEEQAEEFSDNAQLSSALEKILAPLRPALGIHDAKAADIVRFLPEGGSVSGIMRSLGPAIDLQDNLGSLPLHRHGSTVSALLRVSQALAKAGIGGIVAVDDFGEDLDAASSQHLAATLRRNTSQAWLSTRRPHAAEAFPPDEIIRLAKDEKGHRHPFQGSIPKTKQERIATRHLNLQLLPAIASRAVVMLEGPHDRAGLSALAYWLHEEKGVPLPAALGITLIDAGSVDGSGGSNALPRLAKAARKLGWRTVSIIDYDKTAVQAQAELKNNLAEADAVIRLPPNHAIEQALLIGLDDNVIRTALKELQAAFGTVLPAHFDELTGSSLRAEARKLIKHGPGLHAQFIGALPDGIFPPLAKSILEKAIEVVERGLKGHIQL